MPLEYEWIAGETARPQGAFPNAGGSERPDRALRPLGPASVSACVVVRNEAAVIGRCLESLTQVVDEIVLVHDGPCQDDTLAIAAKARCRVFVAPAYGHCEHHLPFAYEHARGDWLLTIDADEFLSQGLRHGLRALTAHAGVD